MFECVRHSGGRHDERSHGFQSPVPCKQLAQSRSEQHTNQQLASRFQPKISRDRKPGIDKGAARFGNIVRDGSDLNHMTTRDKTIETVAKSHD